jgi:hypothetical protein
MLLLLLRALDLCLPYLCRDHPGRHDLDRDRSPSLAEWVRPLQW